MKSMTLLSLCATFFALISCSEQKPMNKIIDPANMDLNVSPGTDFFQYAGGNWLKNTPIPEDKTSYGVFDILREESLKNVNDIIFAASNRENPQGSIAQKIGDLYTSGMDSVTIDNLGWQPIKPMLDKINSIANSADIQNMIAEMHLTGMNVFFGIGIEQDLMNSKIYNVYIAEGGLALPDRDYYLTDDAQNIRDEYILHITNMFKLIGQDEETAQATAQSIMEFETRMAKVSNTRLENRDLQSMYHPYSFEDLNKKFKNIDWTTYFKAMGMNAPEQVIVTHPKFLAEASAIVKDTELQIWKNYLQWTLLDGVANTLSSDFVKQNFYFNGTVLSGTQTLSPRWKRISDVVSGSLGEAVGQLYVEKYFPPQAKEEMIKLVENLKTAYRNRISNVEWMTDSTKQKALDKLNAIRVKIGYPDKWKDYSSIEITKDNYFQNMMNVYKFMIADNLSKMGKEVDLDEWGMTPQTINAYYHPLNNEICFPAAILQAPFFSLEADDAVNYGAIGVVIGHEMTHGFDDMGRHFNKEGNMIDWWTQTDVEQFTTRTQVLVEQFGNIVAIDTLKLNGELTLGENIADNGGLNIAWDAWQVARQGEKEENIDGFTPEQRFFLSYTQVWRTNMREKELTRRVKEDVHSPAQFRVNNALPNIDQFYTAFDITETDPLYLAPEHRARIW